MKKILLSCLLMCFSSIFVMAQNDMDAFRFSQSDYEGTARFMGAGGAFSAVGAEFSAINVNPAAIGVYKKSEITFTPIVVSIYNDDATYMQRGSSTSNSKYSLTNVGAVFHFGLKDAAGWNSFQVGFGYNRTYDYNNIYRIEGFSNKSSRMDQIVDNLNSQLHPSMSGINELAFKTFMIDIDENTGNYFSPYYHKSLNQKMVVESSGGNDEINISFGGNYNDKLFIGACLGVPVITYNEKTRFSETDPLKDTYADYYDIYESLRVRTTGINFKVGVIYQPIDFLRIGVAFHTPTYYEKVKNTYIQEMNTHYWTGDESGIFTHDYNMNYTLTTPLRAIGSVAFLIKKRAFVSAEYEYSGYNMAKMTANDYDFVVENETIQQKYGACHKIRVGAEVYVTNIFMLRAGYNYKSSGYKVNNGNSDASHSASAGFGFRTKHFLFDVAYVFKTKSEKMWLYDSDYVDPASVKTNTHRIVATLGCKF